jgi:hypothetical protein
MAVEKRHHAVTKLLLDVDHFKARKILDWHMSLDIHTSATL